MSTTERGRPSAGVSLGTARSEAGGLAGESTLTDRVRSLRLPRGSESGAAWRTRLPWALCVLLAASTVVLAFARLGEPTIESGSVGAAAPSPAHLPTGSDVAGSTAAASSPAIKVAAAGDIVLESKGYIIPAHQILVSPKVSGMVTKLYIEEGQRVKKDEVLAEIERTDYEADQARASAALAMAEQKLLELTRGFRPEEKEQAHAELEEAEAQLKQLEQEYNRNERLRLSKAVANKEFEQSQASYIAMARRVDKLRNAYQLMMEGPRQERIDLAKAEVQQAKADLAKADWRLGNCTIKAPVSGTILRKNAEEGNIVNPIAFNGSYSLCELADLADLEVELNIQERDVARVFKGQRCRVRADAFSERVYDGIVSRLMPIADRAKGAIPVRVKLSVPADEEGVYLKPEMGAVVAFLAPEGAPGK